MQRSIRTLTLVALTSLVLGGAITAAEPFSPEDLLALKQVTGARVSPDGQWIAYTVEVPRRADEKPGDAYSELYLVSVKTGEIKALLTGAVEAKSIAWTPDGSGIAFLADGEEKKAKKQVWLIPAKGRKAQQITRSETSVTDFRWHPSGKKIAYLATAPKSAREIALDEKGYKFIFYEEDLKPKNLYLLDLDNAGAGGIGEPLTREITVWSFEFSPDGNAIAASITEKNLIDQWYMFRKIHILDLKTGALRQLTNNPGKLGNFAFSPDGMHLAYAAAKDQKDNQVSQVFVIPLGGGDARNLTPADFPGHVTWVGWKDKNTLVYRSHEGVNTTLSTVGVAGGEREVILNSADTGIVFEAPDFTRAFNNFALVGNSPTFPGEVYYWNGGKEMRRLTFSNPWLTERKLGKQEAIRYLARDGQEIEGLLIYPVDYQAEQQYPLVVIVHGGPESNFSNEWITRYSEPGQVLAGKGYAVFYPNYRASTGYGVEFALQGYGDPAGKEFDDIADGLDYLIQQGIGDRSRVGVGGGSYGGYASAWFATYYTQFVKAVCMFVGVSNLISKRNTTDIPYEELYVHSGKKLEAMWELSLQRSPIYWAQQSKTAVLILGGTDDTRVHPSQSLEFYRQLKMNDHPAVRLVQYPGEKHGNKKQSSRSDMLYRILDWYDWYVKDARPLEGPLPPLDISDKYGLELPE